MSQLPETVTQWITYVERNCSHNNLDTVMPQDAMSLDDAVHLACRLDMTLQLAHGRYIFLCRKDSVESLKSCREER